MKSVLVALSAAAALGAASTAHAQAFPGKSLTLIVTTAAGGPIDTLARIWADQLRKKSSENVVVENRAGGAGVLAMSALATAPADGHTLTLGGNQIQVLLVKDLGYDPAKVTPVSILAQSSFTLTAGKQSPFKSYSEFIAFAKANPGKLTLGFVPGVHELYSHAFSREIGIQPNLIPYKGTAPLETALLAGEINATLLSNYTRVQSGQLLGLATSADTRRPEIPDVPTFKDLKIGYEPHGLITVWARSDTPAALLDRINREAVEFARSPDFVATATKKLGLEPMGTTREQALSATSAELATLRGVAERAGVKPQ
jgi:tripartite-type tricarboxylate transporter receptor subunit TctC